MLDTQLNAYHDNKPSAAYKRAQIMATAKTLVDFTVQEIANLLKLPYHAVQPRVSELLAMGLIIVTSKRRIGRVKESMVYEVNPNPIPQRKRMKPVGNKELWGEMMQAAYANNAQPNAYHIHKMQQLAIAWITDLSRGLK